MLEVSVENAPNGERLVRGRMDGRSVAIPLTHGLNLGEAAQICHLILDTAARLEIPLAEARAQVLARTLPS